MSRKNYRILQIDDQPEFHKQMRYVFGDRFEFEGVVNETKLEEKIKNNPEFDIVLLDLVLDDSNEFKGLDLIPKLRKNWPDIPIIVITQDKKKSTVVAAMKAGANNFLDKADFDLEYWEQVFLEAIEQKETKENLKSELKKEKEKNKYVEPSTSPFIGESSLVDALKQTLKAVAKNPNVTVMITGETGVGKSVAARFFHANSPTRKSYPFQEINIATISKETIASQLFGHKKGSFTGAIKDNDGLLKSANQGIVFLDEIAELDEIIQVQLLTFLQEKTITPIGANASIVLDVQILAATNKNLAEEVNKGNFRYDLYKRLNVFPIQIPPLRERREDIMLLLAYFIKCTVNELTEHFEPDVLHFLVHECLWNGNVRELDGAVTYMLIQKDLKNLNKVSKECLHPDLYIRHDTINLPLAHNQLQIQLGEPHNPISFKTLDEEIAYKKLKAIEDALIERNGKKKDVAEDLGYKSDDNLRYAVATLLRDYSYLAKHFSAIEKNYHRLFKNIGI